MTKRVNTTFFICSIQNEFATVLSVIIKATMIRRGSAMNQTTKKQHYIWRSYLAPWTNNNSNTGKIFCFRDNKVFPVSLMNIAHENYFYGIKELSKAEKELIYEMTIKM